MFTAINMVYSEVANLLYYMSQLIVLKTNLVVLQLYSITTYGGESKTTRLLIEDDLATQVGKLTDRLNQLESCVRQRGVAFTAAMSDHRTNLTLHEILHYDQLVTNEGNSFNGQTGMFTAPYPGLYVFDTTIGVSHGTTDVQIVKNGVGLLRVYGHADTDWETATGSLTVHLNADDHVYVKNLAYTVGLVGHGLTTFSGYLLQPDCAQ